MALLFQCGLNCRPSQTLSVPLYPQSDCYICQQLPEEMPHTNTLTHSTHTYKHTHTENPLYRLHTHAPTSLTHELKRSEEIRAEGQGGVHSAFSAKSFIFAPQQRRRHHNLPSRYSISFPTMEKKKKKARLRVFVCYVYFSRPLRGQTVWVSCGLSESERLFKTE